MLRIGVGRTQDSKTSSQPSALSCQLQETAPRRTVVNLFTSSQKWLSAVSSQKPITHNSKLITHDSKLITTLFTTRDPRSLSLSENLLRALGDEVPGDSL